MAGVGDEGVAGVGDEGFAGVGSGGNGSDDGPGTLMGLSGPGLAAAGNG